jgi:hypothetical protein
MGKNSEKNKLYSFWSIWEYRGSVGVLAIAMPLWCMTPPSLSHTEMWPIKCGVMASDASAEIINFLVCTTTIIIGACHSIFKLP